MKGGCRYIGEGVGWFNHRGCRVGVVGESDGEPVRSLGPPLWQLRGARRCVRTIRAVVPPVTRDLSG